MQTYDLELTTPLPPDVALLQLYADMDVTPEPERLDGVFVAKTPLFALTAFEGGEDALSADIGVRPSVFVEFRPHDIPEIQPLVFKRVLALTMNWLARDPGDVVLVKDGRVVVLYRKASKLVLNDLPELWVDGALAVVTLPYETRVIPSL